VTERPDLEALLADPAQALEMPPGEAAALLARLASVVALLQVAAVARTPHLPLNGDGPDEMLTAEQAARRTGMSRRWLYAKAKAGTLPFAVRTGPSAVRFSARGLDRWLAQRKEQQRRASL
jgi:excisionase family DNA binding protein